MRTLVLNQHCYVNLLLHSPFKIFLHSCALEATLLPLSAHDKYLGLLLAKEILKIWMTVVPVWIVGNEEQKL